MINAITEFILSNISWIGVDFVDPSVKFERPGDSGARQVRVLDYACGPGTVTNALQSHATEFIGIDISENMVAAYNTRFAPKEDAEFVNANAVVGDLLDANNPSLTYLAKPEFFNFDLVVVGLGFHHFQNLEGATQRLTSRLKPGGVFLIIDFLPHEKDPNQYGRHTVAHYGFDEDRIREIFSGAGLEDIQIVKMDGEVMMRSQPRRPFMGRGRKPA